MVDFKKQTSLILILSLFLSLIPNFLYNENRGVLASDECGDPSLCPEECTGGAVYDEDSETCVCLDCSISCPWGGGPVINKACLPLSETGEWDCGVEIPIGEVADGTTILAEKMLVESLGIIKAGKQMVDKTDELLTDYKDWNCDMCQTGCYKFYNISAGVRVLKPDQDPHCPVDAGVVPRGIYAGDECKADASQCKSCDQCGERCCWNERYCWDSEKEEIVSCPTKPEKGIETLACQYCEKEGSDPDTGQPYCKEICSPYSCWGCCEQYFNPILEGFDLITGFQGELENDIDEKYSKEGVTKALPDDFKLKRSYILEQLEFSRCELAQCWMSAEDYPAVFSGEKVGKHLLTCEAVSQMEFLDEDQINCLSLQIKKEWESIETIWEKLGVEEHWWKWLIPGYAFEKFEKWSLMKILGLIEERSNIGQEEGCYPHNFYCCQK